MRFQVDIKQQPIFTALVLKANNGIFCCEHIRNRIRYLMADRRLTRDMNHANKGSGKDFIIRAEKAGAMQYIEMLRQNLRVI